MSTALLKEDVARIARALHGAGWVANHDGNVTARLGDGRLLATPTAESKRKIGVDRVLTLDAAGKKLEGNGRTFSELNLHLAAYSVRPDVRAVVHAHPPYATGLCVAGVALNPAMIAEAVVSIGAEIPLVQYARPGTPESANRVADAARRASVLMLANHGVLSLGADLEQAFLRMELVEHLARIATVAARVGSATTIPATDVQALLAAHRKAGLAPVAASPAAEAPPPSTSPPAGVTDPVEQIVREEILRALNRK